MTTVWTPPAAGGPGAPLAVWRGFRGRCPACGEGRLFGRFLKVAPTCEACGTAFHHHRADDFPPYIVMFVVCHVVGFGIYKAEMGYADIPLWMHVAVWPTLTLILCLALLQPVKGAVVALQYGLGMHGFPGPGRATETAVERRSGGGADSGPGGRGARPVLAEPEA